MTEAEQRWLSKRFRDMEYRLTEQISRLRCQVESLEKALGLRREGELRGAWELQNVKTGEVVQRAERKVTTEGHQWVLNPDEEEK